LLHIGQRYVSSSTAGSVLGRTAMSLAGNWQFGQRIISSMEAISI
jgi:hypothetical protein